jgi:Radical SAM superfamily
MVENTCSSNQRDDPLKRLRVVIIKPSCYYHRNGFTVRFWRGFMPNATLPYLNSLVSATCLPDAVFETHVIDEYVETSLAYLDLLDAKKHGPTLLLLVGTQSHQLHRALDLAALGHARGCMSVIGGPHPMTCDTSDMQGKGVSFALAEAELILPTILQDALSGQLQQVYGRDQRWQRQLETPVLKIPTREQLRKCIVPFLGVYPARGCPFTCTFCSVIQIAGRNIRSQPVETTIETLRAAANAGVKAVMFTSDNFNKYPEARALCEAIIAAGLHLKLRFFIQCDTQIHRQSELLKLFSAAGVYCIFFGVESLSQATLTEVSKRQNKPALYKEIKRMCDDAGIDSHFSLITGFLGDTSESIIEQVYAVKQINPTVASFYTLCPIPGTEQYMDFKQKGLLRATNLDRYNTTCPTFDHPNLSWDDLDNLLQRCYREFYTIAHALSHPPRGNQTSRGNLLAHWAFIHYCMSIRQHPMSGGVLPVWRDHDGDYLHLREQTFGFRYAPLPDNLALPDAERAWNRRAKIPEVA